jgi:hypothetical protein
MAVYNYKSTSSWQYFLLPLEEIKIECGSDSILFDMIDKSSSYNLEPIIRGRAENAKSRKTVGYKIDIIINVIFDNLGAYIPILNTFINKMINLTVYFSSYNITGQGEWRKTVINNMGLSYVIIKTENKPMLSMRFTTNIKVSEFESVFNSWNTVKP